MAIFLIQFLFGKVVSAIVFLITFILAASSILCFIHGVKEKRISNIQKKSKKLGE